MASFPDLGRPLPFPGPQWEGVGLEEGGGRREKGAWLGVAELQGSEEQGGLEGEGGVDSGVPELSGAETGAVAVGSKS